MKTPPHCSTSVVHKDRVAPCMARRAPTWRPCGHSGLLSVSCQATTPTLFSPTARDTGRICHAACDRLPSAGWTASSSCTSTSGPARGVHMLILHICSQDEDCVVDVLAARECVRCHRRSKAVLACTYREWL